MLKIHVSPLVVRASRLKSIMLAKNFPMSVFLPNLSRNFLRTASNVNRALSTLPEKSEKKNEFENAWKNFENFRFKYQDLLPTSNVKWRNVVREKIERRDMLRRRNVINIPEFYVGSIMSVTSSTKHATGKVTRFVGICIMKESNGLKSRFILRNVVDQQGVEVMYSLYSPLIRKIEVLKLEKRLDDELYYLRDAPHEYSTFPFDMEMEYRDQSNIVPINTTKVTLNPRPWLQRYERMNLKGVILPELSEKIMASAKKRETPWVQYDLMDQYRKNIPEEEQKDVFSEVCDELNRLESRQKIEKRMKVFQKPKKLTTIF